MLRFLRLLSQVPRSHSCNIDLLTLVLKGKLVDEISGYTEKSNKIKGADLQYTVVPYRYSTPTLVFKQ